MAKYYVQSATIEYVVTAEDAEGAALWVLNQVINRRFSREQADGCMVAADVIRQQIGTGGFPETHMLVSEIGFGRSDAAIFDTAALCEFWWQLSAALNHLLNQLK